MFKRENAVYIYIYVCIRGVRGEIVIFVIIEHGNPSSNPGRDCISHGTKNFGKVYIPLLSFKWSVNSWADWAF